MLSLGCLESWNQRILKVGKDLHKNQFQPSSTTITMFTTKPHPKSRINMSFELFRGWWFYQCPRQPVPMLYNLFQEEMFPNFQYKPLLVQVETFSFCPVPVPMGAEPHLAPPSCQGLVESHEAPPEPPSLLFSRLKPGETQTHSLSWFRGTNKSVLGTVKWCWLLLVVKTRKQRRYAQQLSVVSCARKEPTPDYNGTSISTRFCLG